MQWSCCSASFNEKQFATEFISSGKIRLDGKVKLTFTHASEYIIVIDATDHGSAGGNGTGDNTSDTDNSNSGNNSNNNSGNSSNDNSGTSSGDNSGSGAANPPTGVVLGYGMLFVSGAGLIIARKKRNKK